MGSKRLLTVISVVFAVGLVLAACSSGNGSGGSSGSGGASTGGSTTSATGSTGSSGSSGGDTITIQNFSFVPSQLAVNGGKATITVTNNDTTTHTFTADDGSFDEQVPAGQTITVKVNITKDTGFHCKIHPTMTGTLTVG